MRLDVSGSPMAPPERPAPRRARQPATTPRTVQPLHAHARNCKQATLPTARCLKPHGACITCAASTSTVRRPHGAHAAPRGRQGATRRAKAGPHAQVLPRPNRSRCRACMAPHSNISCSPRQLCVPPRRTLRSGCQTGARRAASAATRLAPAPAAAPAAAPAPARPSCRPRGRLGRRRRSSRRHAPRRGPSRPPWREGARGARQVRPQRKGNARQISLSSRLPRAGCARAPWGLF